ncbi:pantoate--beta-alanine ligase [Mesonia aquimarina]|uniref:pantoate--beta-alanine ligase n=1 Tax=Mesonia aquimarina TaxID=1504967 RepID=UPI000EF58D50|nr:pantoate--beta-alanine ligase [Mesonia aquimarina]
MQVFYKKKELISFVNAQKEAAKIIGFVPTMGALHEGHLSLIAEAEKTCNLVVVSIFVNPTQFNNASDLKKYPRTLENDLNLLEKQFDNCIIFAPSENEIYEDDLRAEHFDFGALAKQMEGKYRDGHFDGVGTILKRLFSIIQPDKAFFGEKDYQQFCIVKKLVKITGQPVEIIGCPIHREANGLARSSRNKQLSEKEREEAGLIFETLKQVQEKFGTESASSIRNWVEEKFEANNTLDLEYFEIADADSLEPIEEKNNKKKYRAFIATYANNVRLIDNIALN